MSISISDFTFEDAEDLIILTKATIRHSYTPFLGQDGVEGFIGSGAVDSFYNSPQFTIFVAKDGDKILGCGAINKDRIEIMMIDLKYHRQKIGTLILAEAEKRIFSDNENAFLDSFKENERANSFYEHHGWILDHEFVDPDHNINMLRLKKQTS